MNKTARRCRRLLASAILASLFATPASGFALELRGLVRDYKGQPVNDARIWVSHDRQVFTAISDSDGHFSIQNLQVGKIEVVVLKSGHALGGKEGQLLGDDYVSIVLGKAFVLPMRIINSHYEPVNGARLRHMFINESFTVNVEDLIPLGFPSIRSNADGIMTLPYMPRFGYTSITVTHPDYAEGILPTFPISIGRDIPIVMVDGIKLRGRITDENDRGIPRARVAIAKLKGSGQRKLTEILTDSDGFYSVSVPPAHYIVAAMHGDYAAGKPATVWLRAGSPEVIADIQLLKSHPVYGRAVLESGEPAEMVRIEYRNSDGLITAETISDRDGQFSVFVPAGSGTLIVSPPKRLMTVAYHEIPIEIGAEDDLEIPDIALRPLPAITGVVQNKQGERIANAFVSTINIDPPVMTVTDEAGRFDIQLDSVVGINVIQIYAEHPRRFSRSVTTVDTSNFEPQELILKSFRPKLTFMPELAANNLSDLKDGPAPEWSCSDWFNLPDAKDSISLADLKGKTVILTFWAGFDYNGRTQRRLKVLDYLFSVFGQDDNIAFVTIHDASLKPFEVELIVRKWDIPYPVGCDDEEFTSFKTYHINQIPQTVIIDPDGKLKYYEVEGRLHTLIKAMLRKR
jgi:hypothetical protein